MFAEDNFRDQLFNKYVLTEAFHKELTWFKCTYNPHEINWIYYHVNEEFPTKIFFNHKTISIILEKEWSNVEWKYLEKHLDPPKMLE